VPAEGDEVEIEPESETDPDETDVKHHRES
jgi:hypothetical protein